MDRKKTAIVTGAAVLLVIAAAAGILLYRNAHIYVEDAMYPKNAVSLDLRGKEISIDHYEQIRSQLPQCEVIWEVPFQGAFYPEDTQTVTVETLTQEDIAVLAYLPELKTVKAESCQDYAVLAQLQQQRPQCDVQYAVPVLEETYAGSTTTALTFAEAQPEFPELAEKLAYFPNLESVHFVQPQWTAQELLDLRQAYPDVKISWEMDVFGQTCTSDAVELDFSNIAMESEAEVEKAMVYFPELEKLVMCDCGIDNETMAAFRERQKDNYKVVWLVHLNYRLSLRTDATFFMPIKYYQTIVERDLENLHYCNELITIDIGHMPVKHCEWLWHIPTVKYLILADTDMVDITPVSNLKELIFFEVFDTPVKDYTPLLECPKLEDLNICWTTADPEVIVQLKSLKRLWWWGNRERNLTDEEKQYVIDNLPDCEVVFRTGTSTGSGWRQGQHYYDMRDSVDMPYFK